VHTITTVSRMTVSVSTRTGVATLYALPGLES
jgi:hypothetical protein